MHERKLEIIVGAFIVLALVALAFLAIQVSGLSLTGIHRETYTLSAQFNNVAGLTPRAKVTISGVTVGHVTAIYLDRVSARAVVEMAIDKDVDYLTSDSIAGIKTSGVLGEQYVSISVGADLETLQDGDQIKDTQSALVLEDLIGRFVTKPGGER